MAPTKTIIKSSRGCRIKLSILSMSAILAEVPNRNSSTIHKILEAEREQRQTAESEKGGRTDKKQRSNRILQH